MWYFIGSITWRINKAVVTKCLLNKLVVGCHVSHKEFFIFLRILEKRFITKDGIRIVLKNKALKWNILLEEP